MMKTKIAATRSVAATFKAVSVTTAINYTRYGQKSKVEIHLMGGESV